MNQPSDDLSNVVREAASLGADDFRHLAEALPQIVWTSDPDGRVDYISPQFGIYSGIPHDDPNYLDWAQLIHKNDIDTTNECWGRSLKTGEVYDQEFRLRAADGKYYWFSGRAIPVRTTDGEIVKWYGTTSNIDELKRAELALKQAAVEKDKFIAMLGHELRNPLSALSGSYQNLIHEGIAEGDRKKALDSLGRQIEHLSRLVDDTLDISRLSSGKLRLISTKLELNQLVESCGNDVRHRCDENDLSVEIHFSSEPLWVVGDSVRLSQCVSNILSNAIKFTGPGGKIVIECGVSSEPNRAEIRVTDDGIGMTAKELSTIFKPFSQGRNAGRLSREGLGLGLAITQEILELHHGDISVCSPGKRMGTTFTLMLPTCAAPPQIDKKALDDRPKDEIPRLKVLLVDDDESVASMLEMFLQLEGHEVTVASCGRTAFAELDKGVPEMLFCDLTLPGSVKGWDIAKRIKANYPDSNMPYMVALSGHSDEYHVEKSLKSGFDEHLSKPPSLGQLRAALRKAVR